MIQRLFQYMRHGSRWIIVICVALLGTAILAALSVGSVSIPFGTVFDVLWRWLRGLSLADYPQSTRSILLDIRLPRVLLVALTGSCKNSNSVYFENTDS